MEPKRDLKATCVSFLYLSKIDTEPVIVYVQVEWIK